MILYILKKRQSKFVYFLIFILIIVPWDMNTWGLINNGYLFFINRAAVLWIESYLADPKNKTKQQKVIKRRSSMLTRMQSNLSGSSLSTWRRMTSFFGDDITQQNTKSSLGASADDNVDRGTMSIWQNLAVFSAGLSLGLVIASRVSLKSN